MENKLKCRVVRLSGTGGPIIKTTYKNTIVITQVHKYLPEGFVSEHLYLVSDREIKEGDWIIHEGNPPAQVTSSNRKLVCEDCRKIEATTDPSLGLPLIPQKWIEEAYVANQGKVGEVYISMAENGNPWYRNLAHPEVIILPSKESFTKQDMEDAWFHGYEGEKTVEGLKRFNDWLNKKY